MRLRASSMPLLAAPSAGFAPLGFSAGLSAGFSAGVSGLAPGLSAGLAAGLAPAGGGFCAQAGGACPSAAAATITAKKMPLAEPRTTVLIGLSHIASLRTEERSFTKVG